jgi:hypothetical protein
VAQGWGNRNPSGRHECQRLQLRASTSRSRNPSPPFPTPTHAMFSTVPQCVADQGWREWETQRMQREDNDAPPPQSLPARICEASDSECSSLNESDSPQSRRRKLIKRIDTIERLQNLKRKAQKHSHNEHCRKNVQSNHLEMLIHDITSSLNVRSHQARRDDGKFGRITEHRL